MERALKERIVGAIILVAAVVIVVPVFLDGPNDPNEIVSESISLPGQAPGNGSRTVVLNRDRTEPVPQPAAQEPARVAMAETEAPAETGKVAANAGSGEAAKTNEPRARPVETDRQAEPEPPVQQKEQAAVRAAPAVRSSTGMWAVQLGSFSSQENAERLAADLRKQGFAAFLSDVTTANGRLHRVRVGPQKDRPSAEAMAERLDRAGHGGQVVPHP